MYLVATSKRFATKNVNSLFFRTISERCKFSAMAEQIFSAVKQFKLLQISAEQISSAVSKQFAAG